MAEPQDLRKLRGTLQRVSKYKFQECKECGDPFLASKLQDGYCKNCYKKLHPPEPKVDRPRPVSPPKERGPSTKKLQNTIEQLQAQQEAERKRFEAELADLRSELSNKQTSHVVVPSVTKAISYVEPTPTLEIDTSTLLRDVCDFESRVEPTHKEILLLIAKNHLEENQDTPEMAIYEEHVLGSDPSQAWGWGTFRIYYEAMSDVQIAKLSSQQRKYHLNLYVKSGDNYRLFNPYGMNFFRLYFQFFDEEEIQRRIQIVAFLDYDQQIYSLICKRYKENEEFTMITDITQENPNLTDWQLNTALRILKTSGLIEKAILPYNQRKGWKTTGDRDLLKPRYPSIEPSEMRINSRQRHAAGLPLFYKSVAEKWTKSRKQRKKKTE